MSRLEKRYSDPYLAGLGLGLVLLTSYVLVGRGIGASGAFSSVIASSSAVLLGTERSASNPALAPYLPYGIFSPLHDWLFLEVLGVLVGGFLSARLAGRLRVVMGSGPHTSRRGRMTAAIVGGVLMGIGAKLARGCTSGQALTGGALLSVGSWVFIVTCFAAGYALAPFTRRLWL